jgi:hypothetical protein
MTHAVYVRFRAFQAITMSCGETGDEAKRGQMLAGSTVRRKPEEMEIDA